MSRDALGVDIGGVIIARAHGTGDTSLFDERFLETAPVPDACDVLRLLVQRFEGRVHLVSKCGPRIEDRTRRWLRHHGFHEASGIPEHQVRYCRARGDKAPICAELGITHFIDDTPEVLNFMTEVEHRFLFDPAGKYADRPQRQIPGIRRVESWRDVAQACWPRRNPRSRRDSSGPS